MTTWLGYFGVEDLGLTAGQRQTLITELRTLGQANATSKASNTQLINHWRTRLDGKAAIFEALWNEENISVTGVINRHAAIFQAYPASITHNTVPQSFSGYSTPIVTYSRGGQKLRLALFAGLNSSWETSRLEALGYLAANIEQWEEEII